MLVIKKTFYLIFVGVSFFLLCLTAIQANSGGVTPDNQLEFSSKYFNFNSFNPAPWQEEDGFDFDISCPLPNSDRALETQGFVNMLIAHYKKMDKGGFFNHVNEGHFNQETNYPLIFEASEEGIVVAYGRDGSVSGTKNSDVQDADGDDLLLNMVRLATTDGAWICYDWPDASGEAHSRISWFALHDGYVFSSGYKY